MKTLCNSDCKSSKLGKCQRKDALMVWIERNERGMRFPDVVCDDYWPEENITELIATKTYRDKVKIGIINSKLRPILHKYREGKISLMLALDKIHEAFQEEPIIMQFEAIEQCQDCKWWIEADSLGSFCNHKSGHVGGTNKKCKYKEAK